MQYVYQQFSCGVKRESSFQGVCAKELNLDGQRFSFRGEEHEGYSHDKKKFLKIHNPITFHTENVSLLYVDYISCSVIIL
jgi:hypothetical protein